MDTLILLLSIIGSLASLFALWHDASTLKTKLAHLAYAAVIGFSVYYGVQYKNELAEIKSIEREASSLVENRRMHFTDQGFINAALAFLEKHKAEFPDTYARAKLICEKNECFESQNRRSDRLQHGWDQIAVASAMDGILRGIATMAGKK